MIFIGLHTVSEHMYAEVRQESSPSPPPLPPPMLTTDLLECLTGTTQLGSDEPEYQNVSSSHDFLKYSTQSPSNRVSAAAELAYLYERKDYFDPPHGVVRQCEPSRNNSQRESVSGTGDSLYDLPTSLSLVRFSKKTH